MTLTNAPAILTQLATQLAACASWPGGAVTNMWYPTVAAAGATLPLAILEESERGATVYASGANALTSGTLKIQIHYASSSDDGTVESLARTLLGELLAQTPGIIFRSGECSVSGTVTNAQIARDSGTIAIEMQLGYGLSV